MHKAMAQQAGTDCRVVRWAECLALLVVACAVSHAAAGDHGALSLEAPAERVAHLNLSRARSAQAAAEPEIVIPFEASPDDGDPALTASGGCSFWLVSTRRTDFDCTEPDQTPELDYFRYDGPHDAQPSDLQALVEASASGVPLLFFVHGNRVAPDEAPDTGWKVYQRLCAGCPPGCEFQFVVWSWPSTPVKGVIKDARIKADRSDCEAYYLAWLIDQLDPEARIGLIGYSYGARLVNGAMHLLGGGELACRQLFNLQHPDREPVRVVLMAAATDSTWLYPGRPHDRALGPVDRMVVLTNPIDPVLRWYPHLDRDGGDALGYHGVAAPWKLGPEGGKIAQVNVSPIVGRAHGMAQYLQHHALFAQMRHLALPKVIASDGGPSPQRALFEKITGR